MRKILLGVVLGTLSTPAIAAEPPAAPANPVPAAVAPNQPSITTLPPLSATPAPAPDPIAPAAETERAPTPPAVNPDPQPPQAPAVARSAAPSPYPVPLLTSAPMTHDHTGPIRATGKYIDWIFTRGRIIVIGFPTPHDIHKRAAEPQAYTLPQTKPAPAGKRGLFFHR